MNDDFEFNVGISRGDVATVIIESCKPSELEEFIFNLIEYILPERLGEFAEDVAQYAFEHGK